jgi:hypothetical protein
MKIKVIIPSLALAMAAMASVAHAQTINGPTNLNTATDGDLILGFVNSASPPSAGDLDVDIGSASQYTGLTAGTYTVAAFNAADLTSTYGANAFSSTTNWTVFGGNGLAGGPGSTPTSTIWATSVNSTALQAKTATALGATSGAFDTFLNSGVNGFGNGGGFTLNGSAYASNDSGSSPTGSAGGGLAQLATTSLNFSYFSSSVFKPTAGTSTLTLYQLLPTSSGTAPGVDLGVFTLSSSGLTFTAFTAIPEPATYAAILGLLTIGFVVVRRRFQAAGLSAIV